MFDSILKLDTQLTLMCNGSDCAVLDQFALIATSTMTWIPIAVVLLYVLFKNNQWKNALIVVLGIAIAITLADQLASGICKPLVARLRPSQDPALANLIDIVGDYRGGRYGFFSSHAANTCAVATYLALLFKNRSLSLALYSWTLLNCWTRVYLGVHYVGDLLVGFVWGLLVGVIVYRISTYCFKNYAPQNMEVIYSSGRAKLMTEAILLTYLAIIIIAVVKA